MTTMVSIASISGLDVCAHKTAIPAKTAKTIACRGVLTFLLYTSPRTVGTYGVSRWKRAGFLASILAIVAAGQEIGPALTRDAARARARELSALGRKLFFDPALSASGRISCATCHD